jgi:hypothetical protein
MGLLGKGVEKSQERFCRRCIAVITAEQVITIGKFLGEMQPDVRFGPQGKTVRGYPPHAASVLQPFVNCKDFDEVFFVETLHCDFLISNCGMVKNRQGDAETEGGGERRRIPDNGGRNQRDPNPDG